MARHDGYTIWSAKQGTPVMSYQSQTVARLLGLPEADRATAMSLAGCIEEGMPISALEQLAHSIAP